MSPRQNGIKRVLAATVTMLLIVGGSSLPRKARAGTLTVNTLNDLNTGTCATLCSLRDALITSQNGDTITFSVTGTIELTSGVLSIDKTLTIIGTGAANLAIDAPDDIKAIQISNGTVLISGLTVKHVGENAGGGLYVSAGVVSLTAMNFTGNLAVGRNASAIFNAGQLTITNSSFTQNGICPQCNTATINSDPDPQSPKARLVIDNCVFSDNSGGIINGHSDGIIKNTQINNSGHSDNDDNLTLSNVTISNSTTFRDTGKLTIQNSTFDNNVGSNGAIDARGSDITIIGSTFKNNRAIGEGGGAINANNGAVLHIVNSTFISNSAILPYSHGGAILVGYGTVQIANSTFWNNSAGYGDAISRITGLPPTIRNTIIGSNYPNDNCEGGLIDDGNNLQFGGTTPSCGATILVGDPKLGALANNGGFTETMALLPGSTAIDQGNSGGCRDFDNIRLNTDQRGFFRPVNNRCDIGAFESGSSFDFTPTNTPTPTNTSVPTKTLTNTPTATATPTKHPDTIGVYSGGTFYLRNSNTPGAADITVPYGVAGNLPVVGDWNGDGVDTVGVYISELGVFSLRDSNTPGTPDHAFVLGNPGDEPIAGKWDATMTHDGAGVYRPSNGLLFGKRTLINGFADYTMVLGNPGDHGIAGDWDGDGYDSIGVYRPKDTRFFLANVMRGTTITPAIIFDDYHFDVGPDTLTPIAGDWTGSGTSRVGFVVNGTFNLKNTFTDGGGETVFAFGAPGALPVTGKWTGGSLAPKSVPQVIVPVKTSTPSAIIPTATPQNGDGTGQFD